MLSILKLALVNLLLLSGGCPHGFAAARVLRGESASDLATAQRRLAAAQGVQVLQPTEVHGRRLARGRGAASAPPSPAAENSSIWSAIINRTDTYAVRMLVEVAGLQDLLSNPSSEITMAIPLDSVFGSAQDPCFSNRTLALQLLLYHMMVLPAAPSAAPSSSVSSADSAASSGNLLISLISALDASSSPYSSSKALTVPTLFRLQSAQGGGGGGPQANVSIVSMASAPPAASFPPGAAGIALRDMAGRIAHILGWSIAAPSPPSISNDPAPSSNYSNVTDATAGAAEIPVGSTIDTPPPSSSPSSSSVSNPSPGPWAAVFVDRVMTPYRPPSLEAALLLDDDLSITLAVFTAANFTGLIRAGGEGAAGPAPTVTLLAPTNAAWAAAFLRLNISSLGDLVANPTLLLSTASTHLLSAVRPYQQLYDSAGTRYYSTLNSCSQLYAEIQEPPVNSDDPYYASGAYGGGGGGNQSVGGGGGPPQGGGGGGLMLIGAGATGGSSANIVEADLKGGRVALMHRLDSVLLPLVKWGGKCRYGQPPSPAPSRPRENATKIIAASSLHLNSSNSSSPNATTTAPSGGAIVVMVGGQARLRRASLS